MTSIKFKIIIFPFCVGSSLYHTHSRAGAEPIRSRGVGLQSKTKEVEARSHSLLSFFLPSQKRAKEGFFYLAGILLFVADPAKVLTLARNQ